MSSVTCTHCGNMVPANLTFCPSCGKPIEASAAAAPMPTPQPVPPPSVMPAPLPANEQFMPPPVQQAATATVYCPQCGTAYGANLSFCPNCGAPRGAVGAATPMRADATSESKATNAMVAEIVGGLLGFLGIGHMMGGNVVLGVVALIGWWVGIGILATMTVVLPICVVITCPAYVAIPVASGFLARNNTRDGVAMLR